VVVRVNNNNDLKNSRPCNNCIEQMVKYNIRRVVYSTDDGTLVSEKPKKMSLLHVSTGWVAYNNPERLKY